MKLTVAIAALASVVFSTVEAQVPSFTNFTKCVGNSVDLITVTSAEITPYPICIKQKYCISVTGNSPVPITQGATVNQGIIMGNRIWPPAPETDLCRFLAETGTPCPIPSGPISLKVCFNSPPYIPQNMQGYWSFTFKNADNTHLFCKYAVPNPERVPTTPENPQGLLGLYARNCTQPIYPV
ncbi:MAG: hypothetical protein J3R72DRAFT_491117 [Linnemannia gamsii]|nr:MAG: hypothetical protein J3R72DRAFT_491117 [Linnemannia gamsii]